MRSVRFSQAVDGTPEACAPDVVGAYWALGWMHARYRPLQSFLIHSAACGRIAERVLPRTQLVALDALVHRLDLPRTGEREAARLDEDARAWLDAYLAGFAEGIARHGLPFELRLLGVRPPLPTAASTVSSLLLSAYLGLAEGQERMERLILEAIDHGAELPWLETMFRPYMDGAARAPLSGFGPRAAPGFSSAGGSNAWAVAPERSASGRALLAGDPHLQVNQMPALFLEVSIRVGDGYWLGATIPGLPGMALGRNRDIAWSGTFGVADNVDCYIEDARAPEAFVTREVRLSRRFRRPLALRFYDSARGTLERDPRDGRTLSVRWFGKERPGECLGAYMRLPMAQSAEQACRVLDRAMTLSLHYVIADRAGNVRYKHCGFIPRRAAARLYPHDAPAPLHAPEMLPELGPDDGFVCSANEARRGRDGSVLSTFAQPPYRYDRIAAVLGARRDHDLASFRALQLDLYSLQAERLRPLLLPYVSSPLFRRAISEWGLRYEEDDAGAHAFSLCYGAARRALACVLGGAAFWHRALEESEAGVWWAEAIDRLLAAPAALPSAWRNAFLAELARAPEPMAWGETQRITLTHMALGGVPGCDRGPFPLPGSLATVRQGNVLRVSGATQAVAPAYRFVTDLGEDCAYTALPGGIDGSAFSPSYACWLDDYWAGHYHRLAPPTP